MTQDEFEKLRTRLEDQLRVDVELLYEAHRVKLRAFETIRRSQAELEGEDLSAAPPVRSGGRPAPTLPAARPAPAAPSEPETVLKERVKAWSVLEAVEEALEKLPEEFDKNDVERALGFEPSRPTLFRALHMLCEDGVLEIAGRSSGRVPARFRQLPADGSEEI